jgi:hypothetical protein
MPNLNTEPPVGGTTRGDLSGQWKRRYIQEKVSIAANSAYATLSQKLPAGAIIVAASIHNVDAMTLDILGTDTTAAHGRGNVALVGIAPTALTTGATTCHLLLGVGQTATAAAVPANSKSRGLDSAAIRGNLQNTAATPKTLYLIPYAGTTAAGAAARFMPDTTAATSGYTFGTAAKEVNVQVFYEEFEDNADES